MSAAAIVQARMGSTRLPGKTLAPLGDSTVIDWVIDRVSAAALVDDVIIATTTLANDDALAEHLRERGIRCVRGDADDVLSRYMLAARETSASVYVRITADCPFVDPEIIDTAVGAIAATDGVDYASTSQAGYYPRGLDVEAFRPDALIEADRLASDRDEREHVTLYIYRHPERFAIAAVPGPTWVRRPDLRFTVDEPEDLDLVRAVVGGLGATPASLITSDVVDFLDRHPEIRELNAAVEHRNIS